MQLAEVAAAVALGNAVLLALVIFSGLGTALALAAAELLERCLAVEILWGHQSHDLALRQISGPIDGVGLLSGK